MSYLKIIKKREEVLLNNDGHCFIIERIVTSNGEIYWYHKDKVFTKEEKSKLETHYILEKRDSIIEDVLENNVSL